MKTLLTITAIALCLMAKGQMNTDTTRFRTIKPLGEWKLLRVEGPDSMFILMPDGVFIDTCAYQWRDTIPVLVIGSFDIAEPAITLWAYKVYTCDKILYFSQFKWRPILYVWSERKEQ